MPGPPPAGVSSTVRCLSVAWARMSTRVERPDAGGQRLAGEAHAERARKHLREDREHGGAPHSARRSLGSSPAAPTTMRRAGDVDLRHRRLGERQQQRRRRRRRLDLDEVAGAEIVDRRHRAERRAVAASPRQARSGRRDRTFVVLDRRQPVARHVELDVGQPLGRVAVVDAVEPRHEMILRRPQRLDLEAPRAVLALAADRRRERQRVLR